MKRAWWLLGLCSVPLYAASPAGSTDGDPHLDYLRGLLEERAGHITQALEHYEEVVRQDPQAIEVFRDIAQLSLRLGRPEAALAAAERVRELAPKDPASFIFLGNVFVSQGNLAKAADAYEKALQLDPKNLNALENLGNYYAILDPQKGLAYYRRYLDLSPQDAEVFFQIGLLEQKLGNIGEAQKAYDKALTLEPQQVAPQLALAELYELQKSTAQAIANYEAASKLQPHNPVIYMRLGHLYYASKQWDMAFTQFQNARALTPNDAAIYYWLARTCEERKEWGEAADYAKMAYDQTKDNQFLPLTAYYLTLDHRTEEALQWLEKARKVDPDNGNVLLFLGMNYLELNQPQKAKEALTHGVAKNPNDPQLRFQLGVTEDRLGHTADAETQFQSVLNLDPKNTAALNFLGYSWADKGVRLEEAEKLLRQAVALEPNNGAFLDSLGWTRFKQGERREAAELLEKAVALSPDALIYDHLGDVYAADGNVVKAADAYNKGAALDPKNKSLAEKAKAAGRRVAPFADPKKLLKYVEGNFRQISRIRSQARLAGRFRKHPFETAGRFLYEAPDSIVVELPSFSEGAAGAIRIKGRQLRVEPPAYESQLKPLPLASLVDLPSLFSGELAASFDRPDVKVDSDGGVMRYRNPQGDVIAIDLQRGVLIRWSRDNPEGGRDELTFDPYDLVEGLWVPRKILWKNSKKKLDATLSLSQWNLEEHDDAEKDKAKP